MENGLQKPNVSWIQKSRRAGVEPIDPVYHTEKEDWVRNINDAISHFVNDTGNGEVWRKVLDFAPVRARARKLTTINAITTSVAA